MEKLHVTLVQADLHWENPKANREMFTKKLSSLEQTTDVIILPEMFATGFSMNAEQHAEAHPGENLQWMQHTAATTAAAVTGSLMVKENGNYYNRLYWVFPDGTYKLYDKKHLFTLAGEQKTYSPGSKKILIDYKGWKFCPMICYDLRFPVWSRNTEDYDVLLYVANWPQKRTEAWDALLKARAIENMCYTIGVNRVGTDGNGHPYSGHSALYDMLGKQCSTQNHEQVFLETLSLSKTNLNEARNKFGFLRDRDTFSLR